MLSQNNPIKNLQVKKLKKLGSGAFSDVFSGELLGGPSGSKKQSVAIKQFTTKYSTGVNYNDLKIQAAKEHELAKKFDHANCVKLLAFVCAPDGVSIIQELAVGGDLFSRIVPAKGVKTNFGKKMILGILNGLSYLHEQMNVVHMDLKAENILLDAHDTPKLADFDACMPCFTEVRIARGTAEIHPPELCGNSPAYKIVQPASDIWSAGLLVYLFLTGRYAWDHADQNDSQYAAFAKYGASGPPKDNNKTKKPAETNDQLWGSLSAQLAHTFDSMLAPTPDSRCSASQLHAMVSACWDRDVATLRGEKLPKVKSNRGKAKGLLRNVTKRHASRKQDSRHEANATNAAIEKHPKKAKAAERKKQAKITSETLL